MRLLYEGPQGTREVCVVGPPAADVGGLAESLGLPPSTAGLWIDGRWADADCRLEDSGIADGARVCVRPTPASPPSEWSVEVVGGLCAGDRFPLAPSGATLGRSPEADVTLVGAGLRPVHARLECKGDQVLAHLGSGDAMVGEISAPIRLGGALLQVSPTPSDRPTRLSGRAASGKFGVNRPPRPAPPEPPEPLPAPAAEPSRLPRSVAFGWAALAGPLVVGLLMALLYSPYMALFALLSPLMMAANWLDNRRRNRADRRRSSRRAQASLARFQTAAEAAHAAEARRCRELHLNLCEAVRRIRQPSVRLWERRPSHGDFMSLVVAHGPRPFAPELLADEPQAAEGVAEVVEQLGPLSDSPIVVDLGPEKLLGLAGPRRTVTAIARGLLIQAAAYQGPADLAILVATDEITAPAWAWTAWLPHISHPRVGKERLLADSRTAAAEATAELVDAWARRAGGQWPQLLVVADGENLATGRTPPLRPLLDGSAGPAAGIVLASSVDQLPAAATTVIEACDASGTVSLLRGEKSCPPVLATGMSLALARTAARSLARYEDPEQLGADTAIPDRSSLIELLGLPLPGSSHCPAGSSALSEAVEARWRHSESADRLAACIGADGCGPVAADLAADGPHALVAGTTGSGKSELLRTLIASLSAAYSPEQVNFVLVDYKGGSAFDACAALPHVVGLVTDLDDRLAERALRCLEAELRHREQVLRERGATDMAHYRSLAHARRSGTPWPKLPRLVVVIDEFAALAAELPAFMDSLVNVAQRGRSLGMHLVLATQRPAGAVSANIRTNTALRIALRVLDVADSVDVLDSPEAASIGRHRPGRAFARFGPGELVEFQCALVTGVTASRRQTRVVPAPDGIPVLEPQAAPAGGAALEPQAAPAGDAGDAGDDLAGLVAAANAAWDRLGARPPRKPWPDPLPPVLSLDALPIGSGSGDALPGEALPGEALPIGSGSSASGVVFAVVDDPNRQCQYPLAWNPELGNVLLAGSPDSGPSTALGSLAIALARRHPPDRCHLYVIDSGSGRLACLEDLPHCGAAVGLGDRDRIRRLIRRLEGSLDQRLRQARSSPEPVLSGIPLTVALIDNWSGLLKSLDNVADHGLLATLERIWVEGPAVGLWMAAAADQLSKISRSIQAATPQTFVFRLGDPALYRQWGVTVGDPAALPHGRGFAVPSGLEIQVAVPDGGLASAASKAGASHPSTGGPPPVETLPRAISATRLDQPRLRRSPVYLPLGLSDDTLSPVGLTLYPNEHALILGPPRSGRSAALMLLASTASASGGLVVALSAEGLPLADHPDVLQAGDLRDLLELLAAAGTPETASLVLIDDAETVDDPDGDLKALVANSGPSRHIVAAGRADRLRTAYGHWTTEIRFSRTGVLLQPSPLDGDLFSLQLPTRPSLPPLPGRGYLIQNGQPSIMQIAGCGDSASGAGAPASERGE